jgi:hypothetical protein
MGYALPLVLFGLFVLLADFGERGMAALLLFALIVVIYLLVFGVWHAWKKQAPPFNKTVIACWLITTFFIAQLASSL